MKLKEDFAKKEASESSNILRARAAEKEANDLKKQLGGIKGEFDKERIGLLDKIEKLTSDL